MGNGARVSEETASRALAALLPRTQTGAARSAVALGPGVVVDGDRSFVGRGTAFDERELAKRIEGRQPPTVVVLRKTSSTLVRALRKRPPALLVVLGDVALPELPDTLVLGPRAVLRVDEKAARADNCTIACAHAADELEGLLRALGQRPVALALCPTPPWLPRWLDDETLQRATAVGYVPAASLGVAWARWGDEVASRRKARHVLVPVGVEAPSLDEPDAVHLAQTAAAHALERRTGPVFPSPRVLARIVDGLGGRGSDPPPTPEQLAMWAQARRALPLTGAAVGMATPRPGTTLSAPTSAFLAQRALLRAEAFEAAMKAEPPELEAIDEEAMHRSQQVLEGAGQTLTDQESKVVLRGFGFEVTRQAVASSPSGAAGFADRIGYPVVLKALSPDLRRRSDVGGVMLALSTAAAVRRAYATIVENVERRAPTARLDGVLVAEMIEDGLDVRCGGVRLPDGEVVIYGCITLPGSAGPDGVGAAVEPSLALHPLSGADALALAHAVVSRAPVPALRRETDPDVRGLAALLLRVSRLIEHTGDRIVSVDLGPARLVGPPRHWVTLDARITQKAHLEGV